MKWPWQCQFPKRADKMVVVEAETLGNFDARSRYSYRKLEEDFIPKPSHVLGEGINGPVIMAVNRFTGQECAAKIFEKTHLSQTKLDDLRREVNNYLKVDHPHVARLLHVYEDSHRLSLVMELCEGKDLITRLEEKTQFSEREALEASYQILLAVAYLHKHSIAHCDLKLDNCLYDADEENATLKIIDFGFSKVWDQREFLQKRNGTTRYAAPEVFTGNYTSKCDMWSFGVCVFLLLEGSFPFDSDTEAETALKVGEGKFTFAESRWCNVSAEAKDFIRKLLVVDPTRRMSAAECLRHPWMLEIDCRNRSECETAFTTQVFPQDLVEDLRVYSRCSHLKRAMLTMMAHHLPSIDLADIQSVFLALDTDRTGALTRENFFAALGFGQIGGPTEEELQHIFDVVDVAGDGEIHFSEFVAAVMLRRVRIDQLLVREAFEFFAVSRTGRITRNDLLLVLGGPKFQETEINTLFLEGGCSPKTGITFERFSEHLKGSEELVSIQSRTQSALAKAAEIASRLPAKYGVHIPVKRAFNAEAFFTI